MMRRAGWRAVALVSSVVLAASFCFAAMSAFADFYRSDTPALVYDGRDKKFSYRNVENGDLFASFKDLMPGDCTHQAFSIEAVNIEEPVTMYVKASYDNTETAGIEDIALSASFGGNVAVEGTLGDSHGMGQWVNLGVFSQDTAIDGAIELEIPTTLGNDSARDERELVWTFIAQEQGGASSPGEESLPNTDGTSDDGLISAQSDEIAKTGDLLHGAAIAWFGAALVSMMVLLAAVRRLRSS